MPHRGSMVEFPVALANLETGGVTCSNVEVRYKGNFTYLATARVLKRSLKIDFAFQNEGGSRFHDLRKINLHAGVLDASLVPSGGGCSCRLNEKPLSRHDLFTRIGHPLPGNILFGAERCPAIFSAKLDILLASGSFFHACGLKACFGWPANSNGSSGDPYPDESKRCLGSSIGRAVDS